MGSSVRDSPSSATTRQHIFYLLGKMKTFLIAMIVFMTLLSTPSTSTPVASASDLTEKKSLFMRILKGFTPNQHLHGAASGREDSLIDDLSFNNVVEWIAEDAVESVAERIIES